jgi:signal-transduction protein with cAMP-binding, CBS, and nucleotidyltransferase domain
VPFMETGYKVLDAMTKMPVTISPKKTVDDCAKLMHKHDVGSLLVVASQSPHAVQGIITHEHLVNRVLAKDLVPSSVKVEDIMQKEIISLSPDLDIYDALLKLNAFSMRQAPVIHNSVLVGYLTLKDILKIEPDLFELIASGLKIREEERKPVEYPIQIID